MTNDPPVTGALDQRAREILDFERGWWRDRRPKERAIRETFGFSAARYQQLLNRIVDQPAALAYDPMLVRRLRRLREQRRRRRVATRLGVPV
jgi:hypothetical protein